MIKVRMMGTPEEQRDNNTKHVRNVFEQGHREILPYVR